MRKRWSLSGLIAGIAMVASFAAWRAPEYQELYASLRAPIAEQQIEELIGALDTLNTDLQKMSENYASAPAQSAARAEPPAVLSPEEPASHVVPLSPQPSAIIDSVGKSYLPGQDPYRIARWNQERNDEWYGILAEPGTVQSGKWEVPVRQNAQGITIELRTALPHDDLVFRLLFQEKGHFVQSTYLAAGQSSALTLHEIPQEPIQYELVRPLPQDRFSLEVLASGRNLYFIPTAVPAPIAPALPTDAELVLESASMVPNPLPSEPAAPTLPQRSEPQRIQYALTRSRWEPFQSFIG